MGCTGCAHNELFQCSFVATSKFQLSFCQTRDSSKQIRATECRPKTYWWMRTRRSCIKDIIYLEMFQCTNACKQDFVTSAVALKRADGFGPSAANDTMELEYMWYKRGVTLWRILCPCMLQTIIFLGGFWPFLGFVGGVDPLVRNSGLTISPRVSWWTGRCMLGAVWKMMAWFYWPLKTKVKYTWRIAIIYEFAKWGCRDVSKSTLVSCLLESLSSMIQNPPNLGLKKYTRWFKVAFLSPNWRSLNRLKRSLNNPKKVTLNHQVQANCQECSTSAADATLDGGDTKNVFPFIRWKPRRDQDHFVLGTFRFHKGHKLKDQHFLNRDVDFKLHTNLLQWSIKMVQTKLMRELLLSNCWHSCGLWHQRYQN